MSTVVAPIRLGLQIPDFNFPDVGTTEIFSTLVEIAGTAESSGIDSLFVMDHLHQISVLGPRTNWMLEGNTILAALAARTTTINLGLLVAGVTHRNPALLAKITTTLDVISSGRALLGIGAAWNEDEHEAFGIEFSPVRERYERLEEALQIVRAMFTQPESNFDGTYYHINDVPNSPQPLRGDIPILVGGSGERKTLRIVAQYADACNITGGIDRVRHLVDVLATHCEAVGRDPTTITKTILGTVVIGRSRRECQRKLDLVHRKWDMPDEVIISGDPPTVAQRIADLIDVGLDGVIVNLPDVYDVEAVAMVGETIRPVVSPASSRNSA